MERATKCGKNLDKKCRPSPVEWKKADLGEEEEAMKRMDKLCAIDVTHVPLAIVIISLISDIARKHGNSKKRNRGPAVVNRVLHFCAESPVTTMHHL
ncbi:hypothetical protein KM043_015503 [Ampulex compressa]|nr:hypothetical protein KM043_015503 [Ampulex compressa]